MLASTETLSEPRKSFADHVPLARSAEPMKRGGVFVLHRRERLVEY